MTVEPTLARANLESLCEYSLQLNRWLLIPIGAWPSSLSTSKIERIVSLFVIVISYSSILTTVIPCFLYMILDDDTIQQKLMMIGPLSHWFVGGLNYTTLLLRKREIECCVRHMQTDWQSVTKSKDQEIMLKDAELGRYMVVFCTAFMQGGILFYCVITAFTTEVIQIGNETKTVRMLPCAAYKKLVPVDTMNGLFLFVQFLAGFIVNSSTVGAFSLAIVFAAHAYGQLDVLMTWIRDLVNQSKERDRNSYMDEIGVVVEYHLRALSFITSIENMMTEICFLEMFECTFNICMLGYEIPMRWADRDYRNLTPCIVVLCSMSFNIFIVCYIGEKLSEQCKMVGESVYMTNWYHLPEKHVLDMLLIISRSSTEVRLTGGKFFTMSLYTFANVMKSSFAYVNVLRQTT